MWDIADENENGPISRETGGARAGPSYARGEAAYAR
jgi:hypothetical protein